jgi:hypothetical protein
VAADSGCAPVCFFKALDPERLHSLLGVNAIKSMVKCVHPLLLISAALFILLTLALPPDLGLFPRDHGPCSVTAVFLYVPVLLCGLLGLGFSAIRLFVMESRKRGDQTPNERAGGDGG